MTKQEAISYMVEKIEEIERERVASNLAVDATKRKKEVVEGILKILKGVQLDNEDQ